MKHKHQKRQANKTWANKLDKAHNYPYVGRKSGWDDLGGGIIFLSILVMGILSILGINIFPIIVIMLLGYTIAFIGIFRKQK